MDLEKKIPKESNKVSDWYWLTGTNLLVEPI